MWDRSTGGPRRRSAGTAGRRAHRRRLPGVVAGLHYALAVRPSGIDRDGRDSYLETTEVVMLSKTMLGAGVVLSAALLAGCQNTREGMAEDAQNAQAASERAAERSAEEAREAGRDVAQATEHAAEATADAAREMGQDAREGMAAAGQVARESAGEVASAGDAAQQTAQIKSALMADTSIDSVGIDVDTDADTRTVTLKGRVATAAQKTRASQIATQKAPGYKITNNLQVGR